MKGLGIVVFLAFFAALPGVWAQSVPCLDEVEKLAAASIEDLKGGLPKTKAYYWSHQNELPNACVVQLEYTIGFLELQNLYPDSAQVYLDRFLTHSRRSNNDSTVVEGFLWYATFQRLVNHTDQVLPWLDSAWTYLKRHKIQNTYLLRHYYSNRGDYYNIAMHDLEQAETHYLKSLSLMSEETCDDCHVTLNNIGYMFMNEGYLEKAAHYFYQSILSCEQSRKTDAEKKFLLPAKLTNLSFCYHMLQRSAEAEQYAQRALQIAREIKATNFQLWSYRHLSAAYMDQGKYQEALKLLKEAEKICLRLKQKDEMAYTYRYLGELYAFYLNNRTEGKWYLDKSKQLILEAGDENGYHLHDYSLGRYYLLEKNYPEAGRLLTQSLQQGRKIRDRVYEPIILELLSQAYKEQGNSAQALAYYTQYIGLRDSIRNDAAQLKIKELEGKYNETSNQLTINKLQNTNAVQQAQIKKNREIILLLVVGALLVSAVLILLYQMQSNKKKLAQQKQQLYAQQLKELQQQRQLEVYTAVLEGQETERARLARDLHDGLGGMLAGTKMYLSQINRSAINGQAVYLQTAVSQIDDSMQELRRIARNMMPETLRKFGLNTALKDLCESLTNPRLHIQFQSMGLSADMPPSTQLTIYRIVQELIANAIKHAEATEILVQCLQNEEHIHITVEDNGKGFDVAAIRSNGIGLANVRNRVEYLNGKLDIQSELNVGTTLTIEIPA